MGKKDKNSVLDDYEKLKNEIIRDKVNDIFRNHPKDYIAKMEEFGFEYFEDDDDSEEILGTLLHMLTSYKMSKKKMAPFNFKVYRGFRWMKLK